MRTNDIAQHISLLGMRVEDRVTGFRGVVHNVGFDLYGCIQAIVNPGVDSEGKLRETVWFDVARLRITDAERVMPLPNFDWSPQAIAAGGKGPAEKPAAFKP